MTNITSTPAFTNNYPIHQPQLPNQAAAPEAGDKGDVEQPPDGNTGINKNQGRAGVSRQLQQAVHRLSRPVETTVGGASAIRELLNILDKKKKDNPEIQIALVSGGSMAGFSSALTLQRCGFHVVIAEKRTEYTRENSVILKEESLFSLTKQSSDSKFLNGLLEKKLMDINESNIVQEGGILGPVGGGLMKVANPCSRLVNWLTNNDKIHASAMIPVRFDKKIGRETNEYPRLKAAKYLEEPIEHMEIDWPKHEVLVPVAPQDWKYSNLAEISQNNLAMGQIKNLEEGLNHYCLTKENIQIISAEVELKKSAPEDEKYSATLTVVDNKKSERIDSPFHFDLIVIAEGANSRNAAVVSDHSTIPTAESWHQVNLSGPESGSPGAFGVLFDKNKKRMTAIHALDRPEGAFVNLSVGIKSDEPLDADSIKKALEDAAEMSALGGARIEISEQSMESSFRQTDIAMKSADRVIRSNVILVGDAAASGSPVGALGGSLALGAYPQAVENLVTHPDFNNPEKRAAVELAFRADAAKIASLRLGRPSGLMTELGYYHKEVHQQQFKNGTLSMFPDVADAQRALNAQEASP